MKKLLSALLAICMVCMFAVPVFADANDDYIAAVKAYQQEIAAKEAAYTAAVNAYSKQAKAKADADSAAILKAAKAAQAKADAECLAVIAAGKAAQSEADAKVAAVIAAGKATQAAADKREAARKGMEKLLERDENIYFIDPGMDLGDDHEATVDGVHPTDLGFERMLDALTPRIARILRKYGIE